MTSLSDTKLGELEVSVDIGAAPSRVWRSLTVELAAWWPESYCPGARGRHTATLETVPGGLLKETWENGCSVVHGRVLALSPERLLQIEGSTFPEWGGPIKWLGSWQLTDCSAGTGLVFHESSIGRVKRSTLEMRLEGWSYLLGGALKAHAEGLAIPGRFDSCWLKGRNGRLTLVRRAGSGIGAEGPDTEPC